MFHDLGIEVFSPGAYIEPAKGSPCGMRPPIPGLVYDPDDLAAFHALGQEGKDNKECLTREFVDRFDAILVMHIPSWISINWPVMKHKPVIWRTIGQSLDHNEAQLKPYRDQGLKIVRYSPKERTLGQYIGEDALIRFAKYPSDYGPWNGSKEGIMTIGQSMRDRGPACGWDIFNAATMNFPTKLFGPGNENTGPLSAGKLSYPELLQAMNDNRVYFYTGTHPASYTLNFMESLCTGIPLVCIGPKNGNMPGYGLYEVDELIEDGVTGFVSDNLTVLQQHITELLKDPGGLGKQISTQARAKAIEVFGVDNIKQQWMDFLKGL